MSFAPKWKFDTVLAVVILIWFLGGRALFRGPDLSVFLTEASGMLAFVFLGAALSLGPLSRLWCPAIHFIYNRRHLGVTTWGLAAFHATLVMHYAVHWKPAGLFLTVPGEHFLGLPFPIYGVAAFVILTAMAATSWDHFLHAWGPAGWKRLHIAVYAAYGLLVIHVLTRLASDDGPIPLGLAVPFFAVVGAVVGLHVAAALRGRREIAPRRRARTGSSPSATSPICPRDARGRPSPAPSASPSSGSRDSSTRCPMSAPIRTARSARDRSAAAISNAPGTATSSTRAPASPHRASPTSSRPIPS